MIIDSIPSTANLIANLEKTPPLYQRETQPWMQKAIRISAVCISLFFSLSLASILFLKKGEDPNHFIMNICTTIGAIGAFGTALGLIALFSLCLASVKRTAVAENFP